MSARARTKTEAAYLLSERRKDERLRECYQVFLALTSPEATRNKRREMGIPPSPSVADDYLIAGAMAVKLKQEGFGE